MKRGHKEKKMNVFPSKSHLAFLTVERYDIELTNIKISDGNIADRGGARFLEGVSFLPFLKFSRF